MIKKFVISLVLIIGLYNSINFVYPYQPGDAAGYSAIRCNGTINNTDNFSEDGSEYTGNENPSRKWVNFNGTWCFITSASKVGTNKYVCQYATNEWMRIQEVGGGNKYRLYYFDSSGYLDPSTENGYEDLTYNAAGKVLTEGGSTKLKIQVYDDLEWFEYPEDSGKWYYGYEEENGDYGTLYKFLKDGYAIIQDDSGETYSLYSFDSSFNAHYVSGFTEKPLDYIKSKISSEINNKPAILESIALEVDEYDISDWEDIESSIEHEILNPTATPEPSAPEADEAGKQVKYYGNNNLKSKYNLWDSFEVFKIPDPQLDPYHAQLLSLSENDNIWAKLPGIGWRYGDSPMYSYHTYIRMNSPTSGGWVEPEDEVHNGEGVTPTQIKHFAPMFWLDDIYRSAYSSAYASKPKESNEAQLEAHWNEQPNVDDSNLNDLVVESAGKAVSWTGHPEDKPDAPWDNVPPYTYKCKDPKNHEKTHTHKENQEKPKRNHAQWKTYRYSTTGQQQCEGDIKISVELEPLDSLVSDPVSIYVNELVFNDDLKIYAAPEQHGNIKVELLDKDIECDEKDAKTTTIQPWHVWGTGETFGFAYPKLMENGVKQNEINDTATINLLANTKYFYPHIRKRYKSFHNNTDWFEVYMVAHRFGAMQDNIMVKVSTNPVNKPTLHVDSVWSGWANDMNGIVNNGVTKANGDDRDVVVNGGSTMYISTKQTDKINGQHGNNDLDIAKMGVTVYINSCYGNEQHYTPVEDVSYMGENSAGWEWFAPNGATDFDAVKNWADTHLGAGFFPALVGHKDEYYLGDELPAFKMAQRNDKWYGKTGNKIYKMTEAAQAIQNFFNDMHKNLGHYRLEKVMAEGLFTQGQEAQFDMVAKTVSGVDAVETFGSFGQGDKSYNTKRTKQTATLGNKLNTDDSKYQLNKSDSQGNEYDNRIGVSCDYADIHTFWAEIDIHEKDNEAYLNIGKDKNKLMEKIPLSQYKPDNILQVQKLLNKLGSEWTELEIDTGFLRDILTSTIHQKGKNTTRPDNAAMGGDLGTRPYGTAWYNEGVSYFFITRGQAQYTLKLNEEKIEVMDPALCGLAENAYDIRNWNKDEDESYLVGGVKIPLKNKIRTFRYQLSPRFSYEESNTSIPANNQNDNQKGEKTYLGRIQHPLKDTWNEEEDEANEGGTEYYGDHLSAEVEDYYLDVYCQEIDFALKSKLMYLTNATVQHNNR